MHTPKTRLSLHAGVPNKATTILNSFINDIFERIATEVFKLGVYSKNSSISSCWCKVPFRAARGTDLFRTSEDHMTIHRMLELLSSISDTILLFSLVLCPFPHLFLFHSLCPPLPSFFSSYLASPTKIPSFYPIKTHLACRPTPTFCDANPPHLRRKGHTCTIFLLVTHQRSAFVPTFITFFISFS